MILVKHYFAQRNFPNFAERCRVVIIVLSVFSLMIFMIVP